jgi:hypothetical protein
MAKMGGSRGSSAGKPVTQPTPGVPAKPKSVKAPPEGAQVRPGKKTTKGTGYKGKG